MARIAVLWWNDTEGVPTEINPNTDEIDCHGIYLQTDSSDDETVSVYRDLSDNLVLKDGVVSGTKTLTELVSGGFDVDTILTSQDGAVLSNQDGDVLVSG